MAGFEGIGKALIILGIVIIIVGLVLTFGIRIPLLGRLPGDIIIKKDSISFYFPLVTSLLLSLILTIIINLVLRFIK